MQIIPSFDPSAAPGGDIEVGAADAGSKLLLYNLSLVGITLNFDNGGTDILHAGEARYWILDGSTPVIQWSQYSVLVANKPPISEVTGTLYGAHEPIPGTYPIALTYQTNVGNNVPLSGSTTSIVNDGNVAGQSVVEATQTGSSGSNVSLSNDGTLVLSSYVTGVLAQFFKSVPGAVSGASVLLLGDSTRQTEILGNLKVDGTTFIGSTQVFGLLTVNNVIQNNVNPITINGITGGTINLYQTFSGTDKRVRIELNSWNTPNGTTQTITLPTAFSGVRSWWFVAPVGGGIEALSSGTPASFNAITTLGGASDGLTTTVTILKSNSYARCAGSFDTIRFTGSGSAVSGTTIIEG